MKHLTIALLCICSAAVAQQKPWPVIKHYEGKFIEKIAMPVGGIGTGDISIGGNGQWRDVEIMNKPAMGFYGASDAKAAPFFMVYTKTADGNKKTKTLMGPIPPSEYIGSEGSRYPSHGLPRFTSASFDAAYPFATVNLEDANMPVSAKARVFNPFIPGDADASGIPVAVIRYEITNKTDEAMEVAVAGSLDNFIGMDGSVAEISGWNSIIHPLGTKNNRNTFRQTNALAGIYMTSDSVDKNSRAWGTIALTTPKKDGNIISYRTQFNTKGCNSNFTDLGDDFSEDVIFTATTFPDKINDPRGVLSVKFQLAPHETKTAEFYLTWNFPNRMDWEDKTIIGNYYSAQYTDAWDVAEKTIPQIPALEAKTLDFVNLIANSNYPAVVKEAALFNSSTLRSQTTFRNKDGYFFGWEGVFAATGSCYGNCAHVWNYEYATPFLFGDMAKKMREVDYKYALDDSSGLMSFRVSLPFDKKQNWKVAAADGQMGTIMKTYREWQLSGDDNFLQQVYPGVKKALSFAWIKNGWDANKDGVMEGCQHNTMDIEYYGPNPEIEFWYLGALKAAAVMAHYIKDAAFENTCTTLFSNGSKWTDANIFNGEFYYQKIQPVNTANDIANGLSANMGAKDVSKPDFQIGEGCLVDQLVGQNMAFICGLGYLADSSHIKTALKNIWKYNHLNAFGEQFNNMRSYALGDEAGLILTAYPDPSKRPAVPLSYAFEAWTGLEYTAATGMIYEGMGNEAQQVITDVRNRYDGYKRNPFNEEECGNHYARAMASWSAIVAYSGFNYSGVSKVFTITAKPGNYFWSNGHAWGNATVEDNKLTIAVHYGTLDLQALRFNDGRMVKLKKQTTITENNSATFIMQ
ncbi:MAG TPA: GH116 family glycosyl-hydrolase [Panacibacter sp.]|nr:GH116 family glycosyl-hydrolase [Panacibacter sp.]